MRGLQYLSAGLALASIPDMASTAPRLTLSTVFFDADETMKALMILLVAAALLGAVFVLLNGYLGIANAGGPVPMPVLAPGFAEAALLFLLGLLAGVVGVFCHWIIEARIDRAVLKS